VKVFSTEFNVIHYRISMFEESRCMFRRQVFTRKISLKSPRREKEGAKINYGG